MSAKHRTRLSLSLKYRNGLCRERIIHNGKVTELNVNGKSYLALDMPHKIERAIVSVPLEDVLSIEAIFAPYIGRNIGVTIEKKLGKIRQITIDEKN
jgi:hypothetical protein